MEALCGQSFVLRNKIDDLLDFHMFHRLIQVAQQRRQHHRNRRHLFQAFEFSDEHFAGLAHIFTCWVICRFSALMYAVAEGKCTRRKSSLTP